MSDPGISLAQIEQKLVELRQQHVQATANANAIGGAILLCEQLLAEAHADVVSEQPKSKPNGKMKVLQ